MSFPAALESRPASVQTGAEISEIPSVLLPVSGAFEHYSFSEALEALRNGEALLRRTGIIDAAHTFNLLRFRGEGRVRPVKFAVRMPAESDEMQFTTVNGVRVDWEELVEDEEVSVPVSCAAVVGFGNVDQRFGFSGWRTDEQGEDGQPDVNPANHLGYAAPLGAIRDKEGGHALQYTLGLSTEEGSNRRVVVFQQVPKMFFAGKNENTPNGRDQHIIHSGIFSSSMRLGITDEAGGFTDGVVQQQEIQAQAGRFFDQALSELRGSFGLQAG